CHATAAGPARRRCVRCMAGMGAGRARRHARAGGAVAMMSARTCLPSWRVRSAGGRRGWRRCIARRAAPGFAMMWPVLAVLAAGWPLVAGCQEAEPLTLQVGETRVLAAPGVARVAVGDGSVVNAAAADGREVLVFGRAAGSTSLHIWQAGGKRRGYAVQVEPAGMR